MVKELKILFIVVFLLGIQHAYANDEVRPTYTAKCEHLNSTNDQNNAYFYKHKLCCMCPAGYYFAGHCGDESPISTECVKCHYNKTDPYDRYQIIYGPHMSGKCDWQPPVFCNSDQVYVEGSTSKEPKCEPKLEPVSVASSTMSSKSTKMAQFTTGDNLDNKEKDADLPTVVPGKGINDAKANHSQLQVTEATDIYKFKTTPQSVVSTASLVNETTAKHGRNTMVSHLIASPYVAAICAVVIIIWLLHKKIKKRRKQETEIDLRCIEGVFHDLATESLISEEKTGSAHDTVHYVSELNELLGAGPPETNTEAGNNKQEIHSLQEAIASERVDQSNGQDLETEEETQQPLIRPENNFHSHTNDPIPNLQRTMKKNRELIMKIAEIIPESVRRNQVRPIFRCICEGNHETFLNDKDRQYHGDTPEFAAQLIIRCMEILGQKLTPEFILQKLEDMPESIKPGLLMDGIKNIIDQNPI